MLSNTTSCVSESQWVNAGKSSHTCSRHSHTPFCIDGVRYTWALRLACARRDCWNHSLMNLGLTRCVLRFSATTYKSSQYMCFFYTHSHIDTVMCCQHLLIEEASELFGFWDRVPRLFSLHSHPMIRVGTQTTAPTHKYLWPVLSRTCFDDTGLERWWFVELLPRNPKFNLGTLTTPLVPAVCGRFRRPSSAHLCVPQRSSPVCFLELVTPVSPWFCKSPFTGQNTLFSLSWPCGLNCLVFNALQLCIDFGKFQDLSKVHSNRATAFLTRKLGRKPK